MKKIYYNYISIIILFFIAIAIGIVFVYQNKRNNNQEINNNQKIEQEVINKETNSSNDNQGQASSIDSNEDIKGGFRATEIVSNNLPESIEFWAEAYCPGSGTDYDYVFEEKDGDSSNYSILSCERGNIGSHGGCKTCIMSKLKLGKFSSCENNFVKYLTIQGRRFLVEVRRGDDACESCEVKVTDAGVSQVIKSRENLCERLDFENDYNFDGFPDIAIMGYVDSKNPIADYYLYNKNERRFDYDEGLSQLTRVIIDQEKKELTSCDNSGVGDIMCVTYNFIGLISEKVRNS